MYSLFWVNNNVSQTWIVGSFGDDFPYKPWFQGSGEQWGRYNLPIWSSVIIYYHLLLSSIIIYYHLWSSMIIYYHLLSSLIIYDHLWLSIIIIYYHLLSSMIIYDHLWSSMIIYYPMISYIFPFIPIYCWWYLVFAVAHPIPYIYIYIYIYIYYMITDCWSFGHTTYY